MSKKLRDAVETLYYHWCKFGMGDERTGMAMVALFELLPNKDKQEIQEMVRDK